MARSAKAGERDISEARVKLSAARRQGITDLVHFHAVAPGSIYRLALRFWTSRELRRVRFVD